MGRGQHTAGRFVKARGFLLHASLLLGLCLVPLAAEAKPKVKKEPKPDLSMQFAIVRGSSPLCEPNCPEWIWAEGEIHPDTAKRFQKFLKTVGKRKLPVIIQSPGGDVDAALAMGRMIRAKKLDVAVGYTTFSSCVPRQKGCDAAKTGGYTGIAAVGFAYCNSACPLVLAGGARRLVGAWAHLAVHQITTTMFKEKILYKTTTRIVNGKKVVKKKVVSRKKTGSYETTKMSKALRRKMETYLTEMGVSTDLLEPINKTPAVDLLRLNQSEMLAWKLITSMDQVEALTGLTICKAEPAPANCRLVDMPMAKAIGEEKAGAKTDKAAPAQVKEASVAPPPKAKDATAGSAAKPKEPAASPAPAEDEAAAAARKAREKAEAKIAILAKLQAITDARFRNNAKGDMRFVIARASSPLCDPNCPEWISAEGMVTPDTPDAFAEFLKTTGGRQLPVVINSKGGDLFGALAIGRMIRKNGLDTAVAKTLFIQCSPERDDCKPVDGAYIGAAVGSGGECRAVCPLVLAGGIRRFVGSKANLWVRELALQPRIASYLDEMSIDRRFLSLMKPERFEPSERELELHEALELKLATGPEDVEMLTASTNCKLAPQPANCRVVSVPR